MGSWWLSPWFQRKAWESTWCLTWLDSLQAATEMAMHEVVRVKWEDRLECLLRKAAEPAQERGQVSCNLPSKHFDTHIMMPASQMSDLEPRDLLFSAVFLSWFVLSILSLFFLSGMRRFTLWHCMLEVYNLCFKFYMGPQLWVPWVSVETLDIDFW
jgi:hypothetical protein